MNRHSNIRGRRCIVQATGCNPSISGFEVRETCTSCSIPSPPELIQIIIDQVRVLLHADNSLMQTQLPQTRDLKALCEVSRVLYHAAVFRLYETVTIRVKDKSPFRINLDSFLGNNREYLKCVKRLIIEPQSGARIRSKCPHHIPPENEYPFSHQHDDIDEFGESLVPFLDLLEDDKLCSFRYSPPPQASANLHPLRSTLF